MASRKYLERQTTRPTSAHDQRTGEKSIPVSTRLTAETLNRLERLTKERGLLRVQDAIRLAISNLLDASGF